jgi:hypothetical protein
MTAEDRITWPIAAREAREAAWEAVADGDDRDADDMAHEYADGCADVIYNHRALALYVDSSTVSDYADDATEYATPEDRTPERIASICVYLALRAEYVETLRALREDDERSDARMRLRVEGGNAYMRLLDEGAIREPSHG